MTLTHQVKNIQHKISAFFINTTPCAFRIKIFAFEVFCKTNIKKKMIKISKFIVNQAFKYSCPKLQK